MAKMLDHIERSREQAVGERIVQQIEGDCGGSAGHGVLGPVALQCAKVIRIAELHAEFSKIAQ